MSQRYSHEEIKEALAFVDKACPDQLEVKSQLNRRSLVITFKWAKDRPIMGEGGSTENFYAIMSQAPSFLFQILTQMDEMMTELEAGQ